MPRQTGCWPFAGHDRHRHAGGVNKIVRALGCAATPLWRLPGKGCADHGEVCAFNVGPNGARLGRAMPTPQDSRPLSRMIEHKGV